MKAREIKECWKVIQHIMNKTQKINQNYEQLFLVLRLFTKCTDLGKQIYQFCHFTTPICQLTQIYIPSEILDKIRLFFKNYDCHYNQIEYKMQDFGVKSQKQILQQYKSNSNPPQFKSEQPFLIKKPKYTQLSLYQRNGRWTQKQKLKYTLFLQLFKERFLVKGKRRFNTIFDSMSRLIKTRNSQQCRSHHQKMQREKFQIEGIISQGKSKYSIQYYNMMRQRYSSEISRLYYESHEDFKKFHKKIKNIEFKKAIQRQKIVQNRRILRSTRTRFSKRFINQNKIETIQNYHVPQKKASSDKNFNNSFFNKVRQSQQRVVEAQNKFSLQKNKLVPNEELLAQLTGKQAVFWIPFNVVNFVGTYPSFQQVNNSYKIISQIQGEIKRQSEMAYFHYDQYIWYTQNANNIQKELIKIYQSMMQRNDN